MIEELRKIWYNIVRYYTSADLRPTKGRTISLANHAHPLEGNMDEGHGIIFALRAAEPGGKPVGKTWYNML